jgi:hypothetical protein
MYLSSHIISLIQTIFLPNLSLALEYQGEQHYFSNIFGDASIRQKRDQSKVKFASQLGVTLIVIPFWWDRSSDSLGSTIQFYRPDISIHNLPCLPISTEMPLRFKKRYAIG